MVMTQRTTGIAFIAVAVLAAVIVTANASTAIAGCKGTYNRADILACESNEAARRRADNERAHQKHLKQHQREIDAVKAIEKGNKAVRKMQK